VRCWDDGRVLVRAQPADQAKGAPDAAPFDQQQQQQQQQAGTLWGMAPVEKVRGEGAAGLLGAAWALLPGARAAQRAPCMRPGKGAARLVPTSEH
jgi:hypothetical protein